MGLRVYVAGAISKGDLMVNIRRAVDAGAKIIDAGHEAFVPHMSCYFNIIHPFHYERWMTWDFAWIEVCHALVRIPGESSGADREMVFARDHNIPVYLGVDDFLNSIQVAQYNLTQNKIKETSHAP